MLVIVVKRIRGGICHAIYRYVITSNKNMKDYGENKEVLYLNYQDANKLYRWAVLLELLVNKFEWIKDTSK